MYFPLNSSLHFIGKASTNTCMSQMKYMWMQKLLESAWVSVFLDPRINGVDLPEYLKQETHIVLQYGHQMPIPIRDLLVNEAGIFATLTFHQAPFETFVPWDAVFAITDGDERMQVWPRDIPPDLELLLHPTSSQPKPEKVKAPPPEAQTTNTKARPTYLKLVD